MSTFPTTVKFAVALLVMYLDAAHSTKAVELFGAIQAAAGCR